MNYELDRLKDELQNIYIKNMGDLVVLNFMLLLLIIKKLDERN